MLQGRWPASSATSVSLGKVRKCFQNFFDRTDLKNTVFENYWKSLIWHCERSELWLNFAEKGQFGEMLKTEACGQIVLPDRLIMGQKLVEKAKSQKSLQIRHFEWFSNYEILKLAAKQCYQTVHFKKYKNWSKMHKMENFKWHILGDFQTMKSWSLW